MRSDARKRSEQSLKQRKEYQKKRKINKTKNEIRKEKRRQIGKIEKGRGKWKKRVSDHSPTATYDFASVFGNERAPNLLPVGIKEKRQYSRKKEVNFRDFRPHVQVELYRYLLFIINRKVGGKKKRGAE